MDIQLFVISLGNVCNNLNSAVTHLELYRKTKTPTIWTGFKKECEEKKRAAATQTPQGRLGMHETA